ncbi:hypothetical protein [Clostridium saccharoperbutylacetonicum]
MRKKKLMFIPLLILMLLMLSSLASKILYGTWSIMDSPKRIELFGRDYYRKNTNVEILQGDKKPKYKVSTLIHIFTGKMIYISEPKKKDYDPDVIYLEVGEDKYLTLVLSGGP